MGYQQKKKRVKYSADLSSIQKVGGTPSTVCHRRGPSYLNRVKSPITMFVVSVEALASVVQYSQRPQRQRSAQRTRALPRNHLHGAAEGLMRRVSRRPIRHRHPLVAPQLPSSKNGSHPHPRPRPRRALQTDRRRAEASQKRQGGPERGRGSSR